jgi:hypothetical protein
MNMPTLVFDAHTHIFPDEIGPRVVAQLAATLPHPTSYNGTRAGLLGKLAEAGMVGCLNAPVATRADQVASINSWAADQHRWPMLSLGAMHPDYTDIPAELRRIKECGMPGIKLHPEYQGFAPDEPRLDIIWRTCRELGLIVLLHAGNDWQFPPPCRATPAAIARVVRAWPGLTLIAAHFGGFEQWSAVAQELVGLPLYLDTSFTVGFLPDEVFVRLVRQHGVARVLFASDAPWQDPPATLAAFRRLPFTTQEQHAILWENAARLFHLEAYVGPVPTAVRKEPSCM